MPKLNQFLADNDTVVLQTVDDDGKVLAQIGLDRVNALDVSDRMRRLAERIPETPAPTKN